MSSNYISQVKLSEFELVEIYNHVPKVLSRIAQKAVVTAAESLSTKEQIFLENANNGRYWIIRTESEINWLVPKSNSRINTHEYEVVKYLFECQGYQPGYGGKFILKKLAIVSLISHKQQWKLEERGILEFGNVSSLSHLQSELGEANEEVEQLKSRLIQSEQKCQQFQQQFNQSEKERKLLMAHLSELDLHQVEYQKQANKERDNFFSLLEKEQEEKKLLLSQITQMSQDNKNPQSQVEGLQNSLNQKDKMLLQFSSRIAKLTNELKQLNTQDLNPQPPKKNSLASSETLEKTSKIDNQDGEIREIDSTKRLNPSELNLTSEEKELVNDYNMNSDLKKHSNLIVVSETEESIALRRCGNSKPAIFKAKSSGIYWIVNLSDQKYLIPKPNLKTYQFQSIQDLFIFYNYEEEISSKFKLIKPAKVSMIRRSNRWQLEQQGAIDFNLSG